MSHLSFSYDCGSIWQNARCSLEFLPIGTYEFFWSMKVYPRVQLFIMLSIYPVSLFSSMKVCFAMS